ncbi:MAG TPA: hypothetical protein VJ549_01450 [Geothrix sp.]|nr:hypothetical protein [Geothrix sp.]
MPDPKSDAAELPAKAAQKVQPSSANAAEGANSEPDAYGWGV